MKTILIGTTAINRSILHRDNMPAWVAYLRTLDPLKYSIRWFINVDHISVLNESVQETMESFRTILADIPIQFIENSNQPGNFLMACKRLSGAIEQYVVSNQLPISDVVVFWLEDDWKLFPQHIPIQRLIETYLSGMTCINMSFVRNNYIHALAPCIMNYRLWSQIHLAAWKNQVEHIDPEHCVGLYYLANFGKYDDLYNITLINKYKKHDISFFDMKMFEPVNSYYTYDIDRPTNIITDKFIDRSVIIDNERLTFIRVTTSQCTDYGRTFMKAHNLVKSGIQDANTTNFYT
jgi:hypothetical protein